MGAMANDTCLRKASLSRGYNLKLKDCMDCIQQGQPRGEAV